MNKRMDRSKLNIGAYFLKPNANTEQHVKECKECGIDFIVCMQYDHKTLDLFEKYGLGAVVEEVFPHWWGGNGDNAGTMVNEVPVSVYDEARKTFKDHPAIWGIDIADEPSAHDFKQCSRLWDRVEKHFENQFAYLNLYPNYASFAKNNAEETINQLGTKTYQEHIDKYCENVSADYISYDFYPYSYENCSIGKMYENLRIVAEACLRSGRSLWIIPQVNTLKPELIMSENHLRFQAFASMAFGAENITWACYSIGWWHYNVLDENGNKTIQYEKLKKVNAEIKTIAEPYMKYMRRATHFVGFKPDDKDLEDVNATPVEVLNTGVFTNLKAEDKIVVGQMYHRTEHGKYALMVCAADDSYDEHNKEYYLTFDVNEREVKVTGNTYPLEKIGEGSYRIKIKSCQGILIEAE
jgi:hypothetical protein